MQLNRSQVLQLGAALAGQSALATAAAAEAEALRGKLADTEASASANGGRADELVAELEVSSGRKQEPFGVGDGKAWTGPQGGEEV